MNEYVKQAKDFCDKWGIEIKWCFVGVDIPSWGKEYKHSHWHWILAKDGKDTQGEYWEGIVNTQKSYQDLNKRNTPETPRAYDLLACLEKYSYESFEDFCYSYGYDKDSKNAYNIWKEVKLEYDGLVNVFGDNKELWEEFREIC